MRAVFAQIVRLHIDGDPYKSSAFSIVSTARLAAHELGRVSNLHPWTGVWLAEAPPSPSSPSFLVPLPSCLLYP